MLLFQALLAAAMLCMGAALLSAYAAWPRIRALEARGVIRTPVPDLIEGRGNGWRTFKLIWATPIPADRVRLKRLLLLCRTAQVAALLFAASAFFAAANAPPPIQDPAPVAPPVFVDVAEPAG